MESNKETKGEISEMMKTFEWKIYFFDLPLKPDYCVMSPKFSFLDAKWNLEMYPNGDEDTFGWVTLYLKGGCTEAHHIAYCLGVLKGDGTVYKSKSDTARFSADNESFGIDKLVNRFSMERKKNEIAPQGIMTFFCTLHLKDEVLYHGKYAKNFQKLLQNLKGLLKGEGGGDVVLRVQDEEFKAHKAILGARSSVFKSMFYPDMKEKNSQVVDIDCDPAAFKEFLSYLYCAEVDISTATVFDLYYTAEKYNVQDLKDKCREYIAGNLSCDIFIDSLRLALAYNESDLMTDITDFFVESTLEIVESHQWLSFMKEDPVECNKLFIKQLKSPREY